MNGYTRLQDTLTIDTNTSNRQEREYAIDVGPYNYVTVQMRVLSPAATGTLLLQHAAVNEESAYVTAGGPGDNADLSVTTGSEFVLQSPLRFLRWSIDGLSGSATFMIDVIGRS